MTISTWSRQISQQISLKPAMFQENIHPFNDVIYSWLVKVVQKRAFMTVLIFFMLENVPMIDVWRQLQAYSYWTYWLYMQFPLDNRENKNSRNVYLSQYLLTKNFYWYSINCAIPQMCVCVCVGVCVCERSSHEKKKKATYTGRNCLWNPQTREDIQVFPQCIFLVWFFCVLRLFSATWIISKEQYLNGPRPSS